MKKITTIILIACMMLITASLKVNAQEVLRAGKVKSTGTSGTVPLKIAGTNTAYSPMTASINENNSGKCSVIISPNPFTSSTKVMFTSKDLNPNYTLVIYDVTGTKVRQIDNITSTNYQLDKDDLQAQVYFYKVINKDKQVAVGKFVIMN